MNFRRLIRSSKGLIDAPPSRSRLALWAIHLLVYVAYLSFPQLSLSSTVDVSLEQVVSQADVIVVGTATSEKTVLEGDHASTETTFTIHEAWKKNIRVDSIYTIKQYGGIVGDIKYGATGVPQFHIGQKYVLFVGDATRSTLSPLVGLSQGAFQVNGDAIRDISGRVVSWRVGDILNKMPSRDTSRTSVPLFETAETLTSFREHVLKLVYVHDDASRDLIQLHTAAAAVAIRDFALIECRPQIPTRGWSSKSFTLTPDTSVANYEVSRQFFTALGGAVADWNNASPDFHTTLAAPTPIPPVLQDGRNSIIFASSSPGSMQWELGALGVTLYRLDVSTCYMLEADIYINAGQPIATDGSSTYFDFQSIAGHEIGHAIGLDHSDGLTGTALMFSSLTRGRSVRVQESDRNGVLAIYSTAPRLFTFAGGGSNFPDGVPAVSASIPSAWGVSPDNNGNIYIADDTLGVFKVDAAGKIFRVSSEIASDVAADRAGNIYYAANFFIKKISVNGTTTIVAGTGRGCCNPGDGGGATLADVDPAGLAVDSTGNIFFVDPLLDSVRKVSTAGIITKVTATGRAPQRIALDPLGDIFFSVGGDTGSNPVIKKWSPDGTVIAIAGNGAFNFGPLAPDGSVANAVSLKGIGGVAIDPAGAVYFVEGAGCVVRKVSTAGLLSTVAGNGICGVAGAGGPAIGARLNNPFGLAIDNSGTIYVTEPAGDIVVKIVSLRPQNIAFTAPTSIILGTAQFTISGSATSGLPVSFASLTPTICTVSGATVTVITAGSCSIMATQAGNETYAAAPLMTQGTVVRRPPSPQNVGVYQSGQWYLDVAARGAIDSNTKSFALGFPGATFVTGDWNGDGKTKVGVYNNGYWFLDYDGNGVWDGGVNDKLVAWGWAGATPVVGDWNGSGKTKIGVYSNGFWFLDYNGDYSWDGGVVDKQVGWGWAGVTPIVGDWNGDGKTKIGIYVNGFWFLDYNGDYAWDGGVVDKQVGWGWAGVTPIVGDWNGDGKTKIGVYAGGYWYIDYDGNYLWEYPAKDKIWSMGWTGTTPVVGDWNGDGKTKPGAFINGYWYLDYNGNGVFDGAGTDRIYAFGSPGDVPLVGRW